MQKQYAYFKKTDDFGELTQLNLKLTVTNDQSQTTVLKAVEVIPDTSRDDFEAMTDAQLQTHAKKVLDANFSDADITQALSASAPNPELVNPV